MAPLPAKGIVLPSTVRGLMKVPPEILHLVINDLPISYVLALSCRNIPYIDECILDHTYYKGIFKTLDELHTMRDYFRLYSRICIASFVSIRKSVIGLTYQPHHPRLNYEDLKASLHAYIARSIRDVTPDLPGYIEAVSAFSPTPLKKTWSMATFEDLEQRWNSLSDATEKLNKELSRQFRRLHDLFAAHPLILKTQHDPSQELRTNVPHTLGRLKWYSEQVVRPKWALGSNKVYYPALSLIPVPYDRYLNLFLKVLEKHPLPDKDMPGITLPLKVGTPEGFRGRPVVVSPESEYSEEGDFEEKELKEEELEVSEAKKISSDSKPTTRLKYLHIPNLTDTQRPQPQHEYSPEAIQKIRKVILGLKYFYPHSSPGVPDEHAFIRTKHTPYSEYPKNFTAGLAQPCFEKPNDTLNLYLFPEEEIVWLESFLWSCTYMRGMKARYNVNLTIEELWKNHLGL